MNYYLELITYGSKNAYKNSKKAQKKSNAIKFVANILTKNSQTTLNFQ